VTVRKVLFVLGLLIALYLLTGVTQVRPGERAVVRRFGRVVDVPRPGLYIGLPWGMDRIERVPADLLRRVQVGFQPEREDDGTSTPPGQLLTGDHNLVNLQVEIHYAVDQEGAEDQVVDYLLHADRTDALVARAAESALAQWVAGHGVDDVLLTGKAKLPDWVVAAAQERIADYRLGIRIQSASVAHLLPPDRVKSAFDDVTRKQTAIQTQVNKAKQEADRTRREAEMKRVAIEQATAAEVNATLSLAAIEAETFGKRMDEYHRLRLQNPNILAAIWWDEMGRVLVQLKERGRIDLLDRNVAGNGLDITQIAPPPKKK
jgi:membrane protease subunit HflK